MQEGIQMLKLESLWYYDIWINTNQEYQVQCNYIKHSSSAVTQYKDDQFQRFTITSIVSHQPIKDSFTNQYWDTYVEFQKLRRINTATIKIRFNNHQDWKQILKFNYYNNSRSTNYSEFNWNKLVVIWNKKTRTQSL